MTVEHGRRSPSPADQPADASSSRAWSGPPATSRSCSRWRSPAATFFILMGLTPIAPTRAVVLTALIVNGVLVAFLSSSSAGRSAPRARPASRAGPPRASISGSSRCSASSRPRRRSWSRSSPASRSTAASTTGSRPAPGRSSTLRRRSPRPIVDAAGADRCDADISGAARRSSSAPGRSSSTIPTGSRPSSPTRRAARGLPGVFLVNGDGSI